MKIKDNNRFVRDVSTKKNSELPRITVNGRFIVQPKTGVQRYARQIIGAISSILDKDKGHLFDLEILLPNNAKSKPKEFAQIGQRIGLLSGYMWEQIEFPIFSKNLSLNLCNLSPFLAKNKIVCIHDVNTFLAPYSYDWKYRRMQSLSVPLICKTAAAIATVSQTSADELRRITSANGTSNIFVAPNGHEHALEWNSSNSKISVYDITSRPFILMLGGKAPHKNLKLIYKIAPRLNELGIDIVVTGNLDGVFSNNDREYKSIYIDKAKIFENIFSIGFVTDDDIALLLSKAICLVFPSFVEGFGLPIIEAMALGCPVVSSDTSCMPEICGDAAIMCPPDQPKSWIEAISNLSSNSHHRIRLIHLGYRRAKHFSWMNSAKIYIKNIEYLIRASEKNF